MLYNTGLKSTLESIEAEVLEINKEMSENSLLLLVLKNERAKLGSIFEVRVYYTQRNLKLDVEKFEEEIRRTFNTQCNMFKMLGKKVAEISSSQAELADTLTAMYEKVKNLQIALG